MKRWGKLLLRNLIKMGNDIILLAPNGKFTEKDMKISEKAQRELEDIKKKLNLPDIAETMRV